MAALTTHYNRQSRGEKSLTRTTCHWAVFNCIQTSLVGLGGTVGVSLLSFLSCWIMLLLTWQGHTDRVTQCGGAGRLGRMTVSRQDLKGMRRMWWRWGRGGMRVEGIFDRSWSAQLCLCVCVCVCVCAVTDDSWVMQKIDWPLSASLPFVARPPWASQYLLCLSNQRTLNQLYQPISDYLCSH